MGSASNLLGQRFGRLVVVDRAENTLSGHTRWDCICDCGRTTTVRGHQLTKKAGDFPTARKGTRSCGCLNNESRAQNGRNNRKRNIKEATVHNKYEKCKLGALNRGLQFDLSESEFFIVATLPCSYCGCLPKEEQYRTTGVGKSAVKVMSGVCIHGIDRIDNRLGYVLGNLAPCCGDCNRAKGRLTVNEFKSLVARQHAFMFNKSKEIYMGLDTQDVSYMEAA